jgi:hypothetical protein
MSMITARALYGLTIGCCSVALALQVVPLPAPTASRESDPPAAVAPPSSVAAIDTSDYEMIAERSVFSPSRTAPSERFTPARGPDAVDSILDEPIDEPIDEPPELRLLGITRSPSRAYALIDSDPNVPGAEVFQVGDRVGEARVISIGDSTVVIVGSSGSLVLRLPTEAEQRRRAPAGRSVEPDTPPGAPSSPGIPPAATRDTSAERSLVAAGWRT